MPDASSNAQLDAGVFAGISPARSLWPHQERALRAFAADQAAGDRSTYLVVPPGGGKTMIGLECARQAGRPTLVLCPNTAIQGQWIGQWHAQFAPPGEARAQEARATASRAMPTALTVLTYQAVASFDLAGDDDATASSHPGRRLSDRELLASLHPNGQRLLATLKAAGPATLVLDECHHLLEMWGRLLLAIVGELPDPRIIGLTATPPHMMTTEQAELHRELFGAVDLEVSAPALVRDGHLAPYQELAWFTTPTPSEADYIGGQALRFAELRAGLVDAGFASVPFLEWLQQRVVERHAADTGAQLSWEHFAKDQPALADAALRLYCDGMLPLPDGAVVREQHRHPPTAEDWVALIGDYCGHCLLPGVAAENRAAVNPDAVNPDAVALDQAAYEAIRTALPSIGYRLTRAGIRAAESPVDRVLARSASKAAAAAEILSAEYRELGDQLRALVLTDYAEAGGTIPATLAGVLDEGAGGALLTLRSLLEDEVTAGLDPVLMTGQRVACGAGTASALVAWLGEAAPELAATASAADPFGVVTVSGATGWEPRRYVPLVTRFFTEGGTRALVGTRALLGEGWDAPAVNVTVDLTAATTPTAVVQARGRALRRDAAWPEKVADNWAVVCFTDAHPKGTADYDRFVRKHDRYFALAAAGDIASGVSHVDPDLSPFEPPAVAAIAELNARMLIRAGERASSRELWHIGTPYADEPVATVVVASRRPLGLGRAAVPALFGNATVTGVVAGQPVTSRHGWVMRAFLAAAWFALGVTARRARAAIEAPASGSFADMAAATADALRDAGLVSQGAAALRIEPLPDGAYRARLADVSAAESATFATALDEVLSPLAHPRYIVPRLFVAPPADKRAARRLARGATRLSKGGDGVPATVVYHAVPTVLGGNAKLARAFAAAWNARVSPGEMLYTGSPEGTGIMVAQRGDDPFDVTTQIRTLWR
jgi:superfamily II DNA or RNA helicase